jgi:hypothetical protein
MMIILIFLRFSSFLFCLSKKETKKDPGNDEPPLPERRDLALALLLIVPINSYHWHRHITHTSLWSMKNIPAPFPPTN